MDEFILEGLKKLLPLAPGINGKDEYFNSAVLVLLMFMGGEYHFVFEKRAAQIRQAGEICFPGGKFDPERDADYQEAAVRETEEELGAKAEKIKVIGPLDTVISTTGTTVDAFLGVLDVDGLENLKINTAEVERIFTIPVAYFEKNEPEIYQVTLEVHPSYINQSGEEVITFPAKELGLPDRYHRQWGNVQSNIYVYRVDDVTIWGITARLIRDVAVKIRSLGGTKGKTISSGQKKKE
ncbi:CoA pyrophosphatase [Desulfosporosinus sp. PR]|uniref:NUDIX hydrolase n=1 Tax=Candidatus Desulfosporosinus nitrosoreducens TaxID=3401928 RepID=UPI0027EE6694|nr:CoA pyrophosphatase [Desulfosporosinus sp. PR]MDQ7093662.1 CoA pyrophosphatase [Desulfosporosinus sp. PR]